MEILYKNKKFITTITIKDRRSEIRYRFVPEETKRSYFKQTTTVSISMENHRKYIFNLQSVPYGTL